MYFIIYMCVCVQDKEIAIRKWVLKFHQKNIYILNQEMDVLGGFSTDRNLTQDRIQFPITSEPMERKWKIKLKQIEERAAHYERKPLSSVYRPRLSKPEEPRSVWKLFHRQTPAFNFVKSCKEVIFSSPAFISGATITSDF